MQVLKSESYVENKTVTYAESAGMMVLKLNVVGRRGWPDRLFVYKGRAFFIEFKKVGEKPTKLQEAIHARIRGHGIRVYVVNNWPDGERLIDAIVINYPNIH
jgi:hypothetical protein